MALKDYVVKYMASKDFSKTTCESGHPEILRNEE